MSAMMVKERVETPKAPAVPMPRLGRVLRMCGLTKQFADEVVLDDISLEIGAGKFVGVFGSAGSGKTTLLAAAAGLLPADEGTLQLGGQDPWENGAVRNLVALVEDEVPITDRLTCREVLVCVALRRGFHRRVAERRATVLLAACDLADVQDVMARECSPGQRLRLRLASALLQGPRLLLLDDPFRSADRRSLATVRRVLNEFTIAGGSVLFTGRFRDVVEEWADRSAELKNGKLGSFRTTGGTR